MRTSNKILLGGFLIALLIVTGIHVAIKAMINNGNVVELKNEQFKNNVRFQHANVQHVVIKGMQECQIWESDTVSIELPKDYQDYYRYRVVADTLYVEAGKSDKDYEKNGKAFKPVSLHLPAIKEIVAIHSRVFMSGADDTLSQRTRNLKLFFTEFWFTANSKHEMPAYWDTVNIANSVESSVTISTGAVVQDFKALLSSTTRLNDEGGLFGNITLQVDSTSSANLRANSLSKLKFIKL